jgi:hypothetical protein
MKMGLAALLLGVGMCVSSTQAATLIFEDDFNGNVAGKNVTPAGWTLRYGSVDVMGPGFFTGVYPGNGGKVDLEGSNPEAGGIETTPSFNLLKDHIYTVSFDYGKVSDKAESMSFGLGSFVEMLELNTDVLPDYVGYAVSFLVTETVLGAKLFFEGAASTDKRGIIIDNVSLSTVSTIPVPPAIYLLATGLFGMCGLARRRNKA